MVNPLAGSIVADKDYPLPELRCLSTKRGRWKPWRLPNPGGSSLLAFARTEVAGPRGSPVEFIAVEGCRRTGSSGRGKNPLHSSPLLSQEEEEETRRSIKVSNAKS
ncbi:unnamed protein product [Cuscuta campestris]|uniref:Uncharacterized protein n=1 Tax=Cuscuta campestris TaxID=132261 RepID=A0A484LUP2_9ASTE|nr:unnamed protein product [Cuscuta campestris]